MDPLQVNNGALIDLYNDHLDEVHALQKTLQERVLPNILEDGVFDDQALENAREWSDDTASVFRMYKRHKFTSSFTLEALRETLLWRLRHIPSRPTLGSIPRGLLFFIPSPACDFLGRPIIVVRLSALNDDIQDPSLLQKYLLYALEALRHQLAKPSVGGNDEGPTLQCLILLDMANTSVRMLNADLLTWYAREAMPRFPGLIAAVVVLNTSWAHNGAWAVLKHVLPDAALQRIIFPSPQKLPTIVAPIALPQDYGGELPPLEDTPDMYEYPRFGRHVASARKLSESVSRSSRPPLRLSPQSSSNPYFGYPAHSEHFQSVPAHGRRRKRDLARTLLLLWWERWRARVAIGLFSALAILVLVQSRKRRISIMPRSRLSIT